MSEKLSILIVDDDELDRQLIKRTLEKTSFDFEVTEAASLKEVLSGAQELKYDCAFIDYLLPDQNGLEGLSVLRAHAPYMCIVMVTGQGDEIIASEAFKRGVSDYISKRNISSSAIDRIIYNTLQQTEMHRKIDQQNAELKNFSRILAHDFKSPFMQIRQLTDLLQKDLKSGNLEKLERYCQLLSNNADHSLLLIDTLQEYHSAFDFEPEFQVFNLEYVIKDVLDILDWYIKDRNAKVLYDTLPEIKGHIPLMRQLFQNLINNALKYSQAEKPEVRIFAEDTGDAYKIGVKDNGIGIAQKYLNLIFEPFQRLHTKQQYSGTGLGLATCKKIVERHKGTIWCESLEGQGATFFISIPKTDEKNGSAKISSVM